MAAFSLRAHEVSIDVLVNYNYLGVEWPRKRVNNHWLHRVPPVLRIKVLDYPPTLLTELRRF